MRKKYLRRNTERYKRLGSSRKKKQVWRRPRGRHNKMRERVKSRASRPTIGERKSEKTRSRIRGLKPVLVRKIEDLKKIKKGEIIVIAKLGKKKKEPIFKEAEKMNLVIFEAKQTKKNKKREKVKEKKK